MRLAGTAVLAAAVLAGAAVSARAAENGCVRCHRGVGDKELAPAHGFAEWEESVHARNGIACDACHGGNPGAGDKRTAHEGVRVSGDPQSRIYFNHIPETCGQCHTLELQAFRRSAHYQELRQSGKGPNCVTCHGSMAAHVMGAREMEAVCTVCHRRPMDAYAAFLTLKQSRLLLDRLKRRIEAGEAAGVDASAQKAVFAADRKEYAQALQVWHAFDTSKVLELGRALNQRLRNAAHEIELKLPGKAGRDGGKGDE